MPNTYLNPDSLPASPVYTHTVVGQGRVIITSGQLALDSAGKVVGADLATQADQVFENVKACLAVAGATMADVVKLTTYVVNYNADEHRPIIAAARARHLPSVNPPASTLVGIQALAAPDFLIEIEATAILP